MAAVIDRGTSCHVQKQLPHLYTNVKHTKCELKFAWPRWLTNNSTTFWKAMWWNCFIGRTTLQKLKVFSKVIITYWRMKIAPNFTHVNSEEWRPAKNVNINREDCILKCEDLKTNSGGLDLQKRVPMIIIYHQRI